MSSKEEKKYKETSSEYVHQGLAQRSFTREWALSDDVEVREVQFKMDFYRQVGKVVPEHHAEKLPIKHQVLTLRQVMPLLKD